MAQLIVRKLEDDLVRELRLRAARNRRSAEAEHREILKAALQPRTGGRSLKQHLLAMPSVGRDSDFARLKGRPRAVDF